MKACRNRRRPASVRHRRGFTLLELMLAITVGGIVLALGVPMFQNFVQNSRLTGVANELLSATYMARTEAIKRRATTVLCMSSNPTDEVPVCDGDGTQGWVVFVDDATPDVIDGEERNGAVDTGEVVVLRHTALHDTVTTGLLPAGTGAYVSFSPAGMSRGIGALGTPMTSLLLCDARGNQIIDGDDQSAARGLVFSPIGRPRVTRSYAEIEGTLGGCP